MARARCVVAEAEIALVSRDWAGRRRRSTRRGRRSTSTAIESMPHTRDHLEIRRLLLIGQSRRGRAYARQSSIHHRFRLPRERPSTSWSSRESRCGVLRTKAARAALERAARRARKARIPALTAEVDSAALVPEHARCARHRAAASSDCSGSTRSRPCWRRRRSSWTPAGMSCVSGAIVVYAREPSGVVRAGAGAGRSVARRRRPETAHRARLRIEARRRITPCAAARRDRPASRGASAAGRCERDEARLCAACRAAHAKLSCWRGRSTRPMQRYSPSSPTANRGRARPWRLRSARASAASSARSMLCARHGKVQSFGRGRARRWMTPPVPGFTTTLLLPAPLPLD